VKRLLILRAFTAMAVGSVPLLADFTYDQTTQITGGAMLRMMHVVGAFSKQGRKATEPIVATTQIKGNRMIRKTPDEATIFDLDQQTITRIHFGQKTYSVMTFEQMKQQMAEMAEKMHSRNAQDGDMTFDVKVSDTGQTKTINGNNAHQMIMTITASSTDPKSGGQGALNIVNDMWIAPSVAGYGEVRDFQRRMAEAIGWVPGENPMMNRPDMAKAMSQVYKEASKLDGMPLATVIKMGGSVQGTTTSADQEQPAAQSSQQDAAPPPTSVGSAVAGAMAGRFGFGRHKKPADSSAAAPEQTASASKPQQEGTPQQANASLLEMTSEVTSYNSGAVDAAVFQVPAEFQKVEEDFTKARTHG
jgi:hypothetical protein